MDFPDVSGNAWGSLVTQLLPDEVSTLYLVMGDYLLISPPKRKVTMRACPF